MLRSGYMCVFMENLNRYLHNDDYMLDDPRQRTIFKVMTIVTLRQILVPLVDSIHSAEAKDAICMSMSIVLNGTTKVLDQFIKNQGQEKDSQAQRSACVIEFITEFLAYFAGKSEILQKNYNPQVTAMFNDEKFFNLHERMLRQWQQILSKFLRQ